MKNYLLIATLLLLLGGCARMPIAQEKGYDDMAYLIFVGSPDYNKKGLDVTIDGKTTFRAKVVSPKKSQTKGLLYAISTGRRRIEIICDGEKIYDKEVFVSTQETKKITLP